MRYLRAYLAVLLWMLVIFLGSTDLGSSRNTSRFIGPFLRWLNPNVSDTTITAVQAFVRKSAHVTVYGVLAALAWRGRKQLTGLWREWDWREFWGILAVCFCYAISDELHQTFVSSRQGHPLDVMFDTVGAALALLTIRQWVLFRSLSRAPAAVDEESCACDKS